MDYASARKIAIDVGTQLMPHCQILNIAGSIRRRKPEVKDVELICLPLRQISPASTLFAEPEIIVSPGFYKEVARLGEVIKGQPDGKYMQIKLNQGIVLDLFMPDSFDYYRQFAIRTGSSDYSMKVIAGGWKRKGWCGSDQGLRLISDCENRASGGKMNWFCRNPNAEKPPVWASEEEFFEWIGVTWIKPELRNV